MNVPKLSIITINLNNANGLRKTIKSIIEQSYIDYEYIIIDGGSTDNSISIIEENVEKITHWISEPDKGIYNAMNKGILKSKGEFLLFLNSGDYLFDENVLQKIFNSETNCDFLYGNIIFKTQNGKLKREIGPGSSEISFYSFYLNTICHQSSFIHKSLFEKYGLYDENLKIASDWKFLLKTLVLNSATIKYMDIDVAYYDMYGISSTQKELVKAEREKVLNELIPAAFLKDYKEFEFDWIRIKRIRKYKFTTLLYRLSQILLIRITILINFFRKIFYK
jgi:glycosyltransferase involved in cell wall biosynthesis